MHLDIFLCAGTPVHSELSPVTDFREACCRQYEMGSAFCNCVCAGLLCIQNSQELYSCTSYTLLHKSYERNEGQSALAKLCFTILEIQLLHTVYVHTYARVL